MCKPDTEILGKSIKVEISKSAKRQLDARDAPLFIEMELYFSCLIRKELRIHEAFREKLNETFSVCFSDHLYISFRPVMTRSCTMSSCDGEEPPLSDFPIEKPQSYIPKWLKLDYNKGAWSGDFGY